MFCYSPAGVVPQHDKKCKLTTLPVNNCNIQKRRSAPTRRRVIKQQQPLRQHGGRLQLLTCPTRLTAQMTSVPLLCIMRDSGSIAPEMTEGGAGLDRISANTSTVLPRPCTCTPENQLCSSKLGLCEPSRKHSIGVHKLHALHPAPCCALALHRQTRQMVVV